MTKRGRSEIERFIEKIDKAENNCWLWNGELTRSGYGVFFGKPVGKTKAKNLRAHRWSFEFFCGDIPEGKVIDHLCRNRACVNPNHLEPVTLKENILRGISFSALKAHQTHCVHGHEFTQSNTYIYKGSRMCRACRRNIKKLQRQRKRAQQPHVVD